VIAIDNAALAENVIRPGGSRGPVGILCAGCRRWHRAHRVIAAAGWTAVLLRLAYLGVTNAFAMLRLLPMSNRDKDVEILACAIRSL
jgi:hypothetical protein